MQREGASAERTLAARLPGKRVLGAGPCGRAQRTEERELRPALPPPLELDDELEEPAEDAQDEEEEKEEALPPPPPPPPLLLLKEEAVAEAPLPPLADADAVAVAAEPAWLEELPVGSPNDQSCTILSVCWWFQICRVGVGLTSGWFEVQQLVATAAAASLSPSIPSALAALTLGVCMFPVCMKLFVWLQCSPAAGWRGGREVGAHAQPTFCAGPAAHARPRSPCVGLAMEGAGVGGT